MHAEKATSCCCTSVSCACVGGRPRASGNSDPQLCRADLKAGECGTIDEPNWISAWLSGSRKLGMPRLRTQAANRVPSVAFPMSMTVAFPPLGPVGRAGADDAFSS
jgi:hypothetical protein